MISRRGFFAVLAGVLAAPAAFFSARKEPEVFTLAQIDEIVKKVELTKPFRPMFIGHEAGRLVFGLSPDQCDEINRRSSEECKRRGIRMVKV